jgi:hypothetical protein
VPQNGTLQRLETLGERIMTPLVYQNHDGAEYLWASHTVNNNENGTGPCAIRWYQFDVSGGTLPAPLCSSKVGTMAATVYGDGCQA